MRQVVIDYFTKCMRTEEFANKSILEIGSRDVNGSVKPLIMNANPREYIGIDLQHGSKVDLILPAEEVLEHFGKKRFDVVVSTETLEHVIDWRKVIHNMKEVLKKKGFIYISVPDRAFGFHEYPYDCWRYEVIDMQRIFADMHIIHDLNIGQCVFFKAQKPESYTPIDLSNIALYSVITQTRTTQIQFPTHPPP